MVASFDEDATMVLSALTFRSVISASWPRHVARSRAASTLQTCAGVSSIDPQQMPFDTVAFIAITAVLLIMLGGDVVLLSAMVLKRASHGRKQRKLAIDGGCSTLTRASSEPVMT